MNIAIDISPLSSGHKVRGVGSYVSLIKNNIEQFDKINKYKFFIGKDVPPEADVVHYPYFDPFILTLPSRFNKKTIITVHDLTPIILNKYFPIGMKGKIKWHMQKSRLKKADLIITDSNNSKNDVIKTLGINENKVETVYLSVDTAFRRMEKDKVFNIIKKFNLPEKFLLYVGDATRNKNLPALIAAIKKSSHTLVLVGKVWESDIDKIENNSWNKDLKEALSTINNDGHFINLGFVDTQDLVGIYNATTALVMPSIYEGFGLPILEAMSCRCPVVCTKGGSLPEVAGEAALYIDGFSDRDIIKAIEKVMNDSSLRQDLSKRGYAQAGKFSVEDTMNSLRNAYESLA